MNIAICASQVPFIRGGAEVLVDGLKNALERHGHRVAVVNVPYCWQPHTEIMQSVLAWRLLDITESNGLPVDLAICTKFPSWAVRHPKKVVWLVHQHRQAYDWYGTDFSDFVNTPEDRRIRQLIKSVDRRTMVEAQKLFAISGNVAGRLKKFTQLSAEVLYPPPGNKFLRPGEIGDFILYVGRLDRAKRVDLMLEAAKLGPRDAQYVIAGDGPERKSLEALAAKLGITDRVRFAGYLGDEEIADLYASCRAVFYAPVDEDYGYAAVEAFFAGKPVVTTCDSGGVLEFVRDGETGLVAPPDPRALAESLGRVMAGYAECEQMGDAGSQAVKDITWDTVIKQVTAV
jgi:glycosyltransferase involved in cell wall biosynthesis